MPFAIDAKLRDDVGTTFGDYLSTFKSANGQVRADIFSRGDRLEAHVTFPTGLETETVTDKYVSELWTFAGERGFANRIRLILSERPVGNAKAHC
jgi:hypothetical protein